MKTEILKASYFGLEEKQASQVDLAFAAKVKERELIYEIYAQIIKKNITSEVAKEARNLRLIAVKYKTGIANIHKSQKAFALAFGKYCDAWKNNETEPIQQIIDGLLEIEKFEEIQEQKRKDALQAERVALLSDYVEDANERDLSSMEQDVWDAYYSTKKKEHAEKLEAERKAEEERIAKEKAEEEERERIKAENERLRKEAEEKAKEEEKERKRLEAEARAKTEALRLDAIKFLFSQGFENTHGGMQAKRYNHFIGANHYSQFDKDSELEAFKTSVISEKEKAELKAKAEIEAKVRAEQERKQKEAHEAQLKAEREEREKLEAELKAKQEAETKAKADEEARIQAELSKGDADKVNDLIADLTLLKTKYSFKSAKNKKMYADVSLLIEKVISHINK